MEITNVRSANGMKAIAGGFITSRRSLEKVSAPMYENQDSLKQEGSQVITEKADKKADLQNISMSFNAEDDYGYIGKDKDVAALDVQKAISDMQKDRIIQQYQYFVGNKNY